MAGGASMEEVVKRWMRMGIAEYWVSPAWKPQTSPGHTYHFRGTLEKVVAHCLRSSVKFT